MSLFCHENSGRKRGPITKKVTVTYSKAPNPDGAVAVKRTSLKTKLMKKLFGTTTEVVIIVPGNTCGNVSVSKIDEGENKNVKRKTN